MPHPVEQWQNRGRRTDSFGYGGDRALEIVSLAAEKNEVERLGQFLFRDDRRRGQADVAKRASDREPVFFELGGAARPDEERDVPARLQKPPAEIAAGCACPDNENSHWVLSFTACRSPGASAQRAWPSRLAQPRRSDCASRF